MSLSDGTYRFYSYQTHEDDPVHELRLKHYLTVTPEGAVAGTRDVQDDPNGKQRWTVTLRGDKSFDIVNVATFKPLRVAPPHGDEAAYTLSIKDGAEDTAWAMEFNSKGDTILKPTGSKYQHNNVADLSKGDRVVLWARNDLENQLWTPERKY